MASTTKSCLTAVNITSDDSFCEMIPEEEESPQKELSLHDAENQEIYEKLVIVVNKTAESITVAGAARMQRRSSLGAVPTEINPVPIAVEQQTPAALAGASKGHCRRHSSFHPSQLGQFLRDHNKMKAYLDGTTDNDYCERSAFVDAMLQFNQTIELSMASINRFSKDDDYEETPGLHFSCPALSYMEGDGEDSVELAYIKNPELCDCEESWENLFDVPEQAVNDSVSSGGLEEPPTILEGDEDQEQEFNLTVELHPIEIEEKLEPMEKRRSISSIAILAQQLSGEGSHLQVIRQMNDAAEAMSDFSGGVSESGSEWQSYHSRRASMSSRRSSMSSTGMASSRRGSMSSTRRSSMPSNRRGSLTSRGHSSMGSRRSSIDYHRSSMGNRRASNESTYSEVSSKIISADPTKSATSDAASADDPAIPSPFTTNCCA